VAKINWHRYGTKLRHCHPMYSKSFKIKEKTSEKQNQRRRHGVSRLHGWMYVHRKLVEVRTRGFWEMWSDRQKGRHTIRTKIQYTHYYYNYYSPLTALFPGLPGWAGTRKVKPIWILLKQETVSGSDISCAICKSAPCSRQISTPAPLRSVFYRPDALPTTQPTASKHWRQSVSWINW